MTTIAGLSAGERLDAQVCRCSTPASGEASLRQAFTASADEVYRFILVRLGGDREAADELLQECCRYAAAHRRPPDDPSAWQGWFCGIARNLIRRHWRRQRKDRLRPVGDAPRGAAALRLIADEPLPEDALCAREVLGELMFAIGELNAKDQDLIFAFYFDGRSSADIADGLRTTVKAVETRLRRARARLGGILDPQGAA